MSTLNWFKSTYSSSEGDSCVEVALTPAAVHVRDSKDTTRPGFTAAPTAWADFLLEAVRAR
ncbi:MULTISPECIES: DUF397 domain-containing protein [unclassified Streptomyces]|uniref:DUF397 domain-containing protein n=1 Tax=unclassified Streptomyces TaxID=2593676 RepID=UPI0002DFAFDC|nr:MULTISPECIES: DUF397 domain-containing protein [unclassified Streptomyces]ASY32218.1 DUF397 domain-containing protein [Streptomyces sp. CLI2509]MYX23487.1 DUF397 domain-containing protein [Streptomyces sp. SID8380]